MKKNIIALIIFSLFLSACGLFSDEVDYRQEMRDFITAISDYAKSENSSFYIIPQNGIELITVNGEPDGALSSSYISAIDGNGQEDLFYGYSNDNEATPAVETDYLKKLLDVSKNRGNEIFVTDYCSTHDFMDNSYNYNSAEGYISYAAEQRELNIISDYPSSVYSANIKNITTLSEVQNFLYLINFENYNTKNEFLNAVSDTDYDMIIIDLFFNDGTMFSESETDQMRQKKNGGSRLLLCYMSIGEAEDYRYYWENEWNTVKPSWIEKENPEWEGNYTVKYWDKNWQSVIYGNSDAYLDRVLNAGFDGVYLDIVDAFEYFE